MPEPKEKTYVAYYGSQPLFSSTDKATVQAVADRKKADLIHSGVDVNDKEHIVSVR